MQSARPRRPALCPLPGRCGEARSRAYRRPSCTGSSAPLPERDSRAVFGSVEGVSAHNDPAGGRGQASRPPQRALLKVWPPAVRIESDSSLEVEPRVLTQIEFGIEPRRGIERLHLLRSVKRPHPPAVGNWPVNPPTREPIVERG